MSQAMKENVRKYVFNLLMSGSQEYIAGSLEALICNVMEGRTDVDQIDILLKFYETLSKDKEKEIQNNKRN
jgi:hypothetical protein